MRFYPIGNHMWEVGTPIMISIFIEDVNQEFLDGVKSALTNLGVDSSTIQTVFFTRLKFGAILIEENAIFNPENWQEPPEETTKVEESIMGVIFEELKGKYWDGVWYKNLVSDDMASIETKFDGLADHVVGFTANDDGYGFVSTKENVESPIMFFQTICCTNEETESESLLNNAEEPPTK